MNEENDKEPEEEHRARPDPADGEEPASGGAPDNASVEEDSSHGSASDSDGDEARTSDSGRSSEGSRSSRGRRFVSRGSRRKGRRFLVTVRYGKMAQTEDFISFFSRGLKPSAACVVKTSRGTEFGHVVKGPEEIPQNEERNASGRVIRVAVAEDVRRRRYIEHRLEPEEMSICRTKARTHNLSMKIIAAEHVLGGEKIVFYFLAERRVDFRALVRELAEEFHTRIELRQVGVRDEARIVAECGHCGRPLCCRSFMSKLEPVGMKQAKVQNITDPTKMSGRCGRLMCCLRFEADTYAELSARMPSKGTRLTYSGKEWSVADSDPIGRRLILVDDENNRITAGLADLGLSNPDDGEVCVTCPVAEAQAGKDSEEKDSRGKRSDGRDGGRGSKRQGGGGKGQAGSGGGNQGKGGSKSRGGKGQSKSGAKSRKGRGRSRRRGRGKGKKKGGGGSGGSSSNT